MDLIKKLGLEKCKQIVDGAPTGATTVRVSIMGDQFLYGRCHHSVGVNILLISDLRTAIANHDLTVSNLTQNDKQADLSIKKDIEDHCTDIRNHISPNTKVIEK